MWGPHGFNKGEKFPPRLDRALSSKSLAPAAPARGTRGPGDLERWGSARFLDETALCFPWDFDGKTRRFPESWGVAPVINFPGIFREIDHPAIGGSSHLWTPPNVFFWMKKLGQRLRPTILRTVKNRGSTLVWRFPFRHDGVPPVIIWSVVWNIFCFSIYWE